MTNAWIGMNAEAEITRVEMYGVYLRFSHGDIVVLIFDVSTGRILDLTKIVSVGDWLRVNIMEYVEDRQMFKRDDQECRFGCIEALAETRGAPVELFHRRTRRVRSPPCRTLFLPVSRKTAPSPRLVARPLPACPPPERRQVAG
jgi:hypothetical protein